MKNIKTLSILCLIIGLILSGCTSNTSSSDSDLFVQNQTITTESTNEIDSNNTSSDISINEQNDYTVITETPLYKLPTYNGTAYAQVNDNTPFFTEKELTTTSYEVYSPLDVLGRPQTAVACLGPDTMPADGEERGEIGMIKPAGWHTVKYPDVIDDLYLYNRCHLIGWQLSAENANELNLITGTRYLNVDGMLPFENQVADYITSTENHVMYRVSPVYIKDNLICDGLLLEAQSVETNDISFCVYCFNVQPGVHIDYATGDSWLDEAYQDFELNNDTNSVTSAEEKSYVLNTNTMKIHLPDCQSVSQIADHNRQDYTGDINDLLSQGYSPCGYCHPE